jgi:hypothetical protein
MPKVEDGRIVETKTEARAADGHREPFNALLWGTIGVVVLFAVIYFAFFAH